MDLPGFEQATLEQLFKLRVAVNHVTLAQQQIAAGIENRPGKGFAYYQCAGRYTYQIGQGGAFLWCNKLKVYSLRGD